MSIFVFDAYGTLFDVHAAIARHRQEMGPDADRISALWRTKQLEYSWTLTLAGHYTDFWVLTERALDYALASVPSANKALRPKLLDAYFKLDAFPDARTTLKSLRAKGGKTGILSNGSPAMRSFSPDGFFRPIGPRNFSGVRLRPFKSALMSAGSSFTPS